MSDATVTINDLAATTTASGHEAQTVGATDINLNPPQKVPVPHENQAETKNAVQHTTAKTKFKKGKVVRVGEKITPSKPKHPDTGGGVPSGTYIAEAKVTRGAPDVRAESEKPGRETDPCTQNHENCPGKVVLPAPVQVVPADPNEALKVCKYKESKIDCGHWPPTTKDKIEVLRADEITVKAKRMNAKDPTKAPACLKPPHMTWAVVRTGGLDQNGNALPKKEQTFTGDTLVLPREWTGAAPLLSMDNLSAVQGSGGSKSQSSLGGESEGPKGKQREITPAQNADGSANPNAGQWRQPPSTFTGGMSPSERTELQNLADTRAANQATMNGRTLQNADDVRNATNQVEGEVDRRVQIRQRAGLDLNMVQNVVNAGVNLKQFLLAFNAHKNPVSLTIVGKGCHPDGVTYLVEAFPRTQFKHEVNLDTLKRIGELIMQALEIIKKVGKVADVNVDNKFKFPGADLKIGAGLEWKEDDKGAYTIEREATVNLGGTVAEWIFEVGFPLANLLALIPVVGAFGAKAINKLLALVGAEFACGAGAKLTISWEIEAAFTWVRSTNKWTFNNAAVRVPFDTGIYLFARCTWPGTVNISLTASVDGNPALLCEFNKEGVEVGFDDFVIGLSLTGAIFVDSWLFSCNENGTWKPESLQARIPKLTRPVVKWGG